MCPISVLGMFLNFLRQKSLYCLWVIRFHHAAGLNLGSSANRLFTRPVPAAGTGHCADKEVGKAWMVGSVIPGILGSGLRGRVTPTSGPATGTSGNEGKVIG